jgi:hypothetical protein
MTTIVKATDSAHFLSLVPRMFGFTPRESVVLVPFCSGRSAGAMRVDLPPHPEVEALASTLIGMVCRVEGADAYAVVIYDGSDSHPRSAAGSRLVAGLEKRAEACGLETIDALHVGRTRWHSYLDRDAGGLLLALPTPAGDDPALAEPQGDQHSGVELPEATAAEVADASRARHELSLALRALGGEPLPEEVDSFGRRTPRRVDPAAIAATALLEDLPLFFEGCLGDAGTMPDDAPPVCCPDAYRRATLLWCLARPALRDVGIMTWLAGVDGGDEALEAQLRWEDDDDYPPDVARRMWGEGVRPDPDRLIAALDACRTAASVAPDEALPGVLSACAWLSWALGRLTHAESYARRACTIEPEHGLSTIVLTFIAAGHLPDWAFRR